MIAAWKYIFTWFQSEMLCMVDFTKKCSKLVWKYQCNEMDTQQKATSWIKNCHTQKLHLNIRANPGFTLPETSWLMCKWAGCDYFRLLFWQGFCSIDWLLMIGIPLSSEQPRWIFKSPATLEIRLTYELCTFISQIKINIASSLAWCNTALFC